MVKMSESKHIAKTKHGFVEKDNPTNWKRVIAQFEAIRRSGQTNMFDMYMVQRIAFENNFYELVNEIQNYSSKYTKVLKNYEKYIKDIKEEDIPEIGRLKTHYSIGPKESVRE